MSHNLNRQWEDLIITPSRLDTGSDDPDQVAFNAAGNILGFGFNGTGVPNVEQLYGSFEISHNYREGTDLQVHVHWCPTTTGAGNVDWFFEYTIANANATYGANATLSTGATATGGTAWAHKLTNMSAVISGAGITIGSVCMFRFYRDNSQGTDTYADDAFLLSLGIHYQLEGFGSNQITSKN